MADTDREAFPLRVWSFAAFHTATFVIVLVVLLHAIDALAGALQILNTAIGLGSYLVLWTTTWVATRQGFGRIDVNLLDVDEVVGAALRAGGWNGLYVLGVLLAGFVAAGLIRALPAPLESLEALAFVIPGVIIGGPIAFVIGAVVGLLYGVLDVMLFRVGSILFRWSEAQDAAAGDGGA